MEFLLWDALALTVRLIRWAAVIPLALGVQVYRGVSRLTGATALATRDALTCTSCGQPTSLVSRWRCGRCGYVFDGFGFARCAVCGAVPPYLPCGCGASIRNPIHVRPPIRG